MHSTLNPKLSDDPHDFVVVPPDAIRVAPSDGEELSNLLQQAARQRSDTQSIPVSSATPDVPATPTVPPVDTTFRPTAVNDDHRDVEVPGSRQSIGRRIMRPVIALLLAGCISLAAVAWKSWGDTFKRQVAKWTTETVVTLSLPSEEQGSAAAQPALAAAQANVANAASGQPAAPAEGAAEAAATAAADPSADSAQLLQSMARDLASLGQEVEQLKASLAQLKSGQQQASRDAAKISEAKASEAKASEARTSTAKAAEPNPRPRISATSAPTPRPAEVRPRQLTPSYPPAQAAAPPAPSQAPAPYYASRQPDYAPRQPDYVQRQPEYLPRQTTPQPQFAADPRDDPELSPIPRPPMPLR